MRNLMLQLQLWTTYGFVEEWDDLWDRAVAIDYLRRWHSTIAMLLYQRSAGGDVVNSCPFSFHVSIWCLWVWLECFWQSWQLGVGSQWAEPYKFERFGCWWSNYRFFRVRHVWYFFIIMYVDFIRFLVVGLEIRLLSFVIECSCMFVVQVSEPSSFFTPDRGTSSKLGYLL